MKVYSFEETTLLVNGREIRGFTDDDDSIVVRRVEETVTHVVGNTGEMAISIKASRVGEFMIKLQQTSEDNQFLNQIISAAENGAFAPVQVMFKDNLGNDIYQGTKGYVQKPADATRGNPVQAQEWVIVVERLNIAHGGVDDA